MKATLDHIGIAVKSLDAAKIYEALGLTIEHVETVETQKVRTAFLSVGDSSLELLEPTSPDSPIAKFIEKRGEGIHHICLRVDDIEDGRHAAGSTGSDHAQTDLDVLDPFREVGKIFVGRFVPPVCQRTNPLRRS